jgi:hypothetical protein
VLVITGRGGRSAADQDHRPSVLRGQVIVALPIAEPVIT